MSREAQDPDGGEVTRALAGHRGADGVIRAKADSARGSTAVHRLPALPAQQLHEQ